MNEKKLCELLVSNKLVTQQMVDTAIKTQKTSNKLVGEILMDSGCISKEQILQCLETQIAEINAMIDQIIDIRNGDNEIRHMNFDFFNDHRVELVFRTKTNWQRIKLSTGIPIIDIQHVWLIMLTHYSSILFQAIDQNVKIEEIKNIFELLNEYTLEHFSLEEKLLSRMNFSKEHSLQHREFSEYFAKKKSVFMAALKDDSRNVNVALNEICEYLNNWILGHIAIQDSAYVIELNKTQNKNEILNQWIDELQKNSLVKISKYQYELYQDIVKK